ncbi:MAG: TonB-dependent receptor [Bacteroidota bacterium]
MVKYLLPVLLNVLLTLSLSAQDSRQTVSGNIMDELTQEPLAFATVSIRGSDPIIGTTTDLDGAFILEDVPLGRITLEISYIGYETLLIPEVVVTSAKAVQLEIGLRLASTQLETVVVKPGVSKQRPLNSMATVSARMLSVEEASRYAGGFDDPARLAASFPGVASNVSNNAIIVRGNAPKFLQWKIEGVEIPNPNHFANLGALGGGGLTALSSNLMANSDFFTGAFPAEYNNALSGVFDIRMRSGNAKEHEHSAEIGVIGIDFASEGPLSAKGDASYLFNYRYSTLGLVAPLLPEEASGTNYQDLSFKLKLPSKNAGTFSLWGIGLLDRSGASPEGNPENRQYYQDIEAQTVEQYMGAAGVNHQYFFQGAGYLRTTLAYSTSGIDLFTERLNSKELLLPQNSIDDQRYNVTFKSFYNRRYGQKHVNRTGISWRGLGYDLTIRDADTPGDLQEVVTENGFASLVSAFTNSSFALNNWKLNFGVSTQLFTLNNRSVIEPRLGINYRLKNGQELSFGYGLHSRIEELPVYFANTTEAGTPNANLDLDFTKAHHFVFAFDWDLSEYLHLKVEPYYQRLFDVPMIADGGSEALLNLQNDWFITEAYHNTGEGGNYGLDLTLEQYMKDGFYFLLSGSVFDSRYRNPDSEWWSTRFNRNFLVNFLVGKEFKLGKSQENTLGINMRISLQGGERFSRIDEQVSLLEQDVVYDETTPFTEQTTASTILHTTISYQWNRPKTTQKIALRILNANNFKEFEGHQFNLLCGKVDEVREGLMVPNLSYKISF